MSKSKPPANLAATIIATLAVSIAILALYRAYGTPGPAPAEAAGPSFFSWAYWQLTENGTSRSEVLRNLGILGAAVVGLGFGIWRAIMANVQARAARSQADTAAQGQITDRFSKAIEHLGDKKVTVRIGGLYALKRIAEDSPERDHLAVMDVISNFVRRPPYAAAQEKAAADYLDELKAFEDAPKGSRDKPAPRRLDAPDILAALEILQSRSDRQKAVESVHNYDLYLDRANLRHLRLVGAKFANMRLRESLFDGSDLRGADLENATLSFANLEVADLSATKLMGAKLSHARLARAKLVSAKLTNADFSDAMFELADLRFAGLEGAKLIRAGFDGANLLMARLGGADITYAELSRARNLTQTQLDPTNYDRERPPKIPPGLALHAQPTTDEDDYLPPAV